MKTPTHLFSLIILLSVMFFACEGPQGPEGPPGQNASSTCTQCHDSSQTIVAKQLQYEASTHYTGGNFERSDADCAPCHTSQGFLEVIQTGAMSTEQAVSNPAPPNCYTCHNIHQSYTAEDWKLTKTEPTRFWINGAEADMGASNVCTQCHQPRIPDPMPEKGGDSIQVGSPYWGPHHGPQGTMVAGTGAYEFGDLSNGANHAHNTQIEDGCKTCHMAAAYGTQAGGHQMSMTYNYHGHQTLNTAGCTQCHTDPEALATKVEETKQTIEGLLADLQNVLVAKGVMTSKGSLNVSYGQSLKMGPDEAGAYINYELVKEDRSGGIHNPAYTKALLENTIAALQ